MIEDTLHDHCACFGCRLTLEVLECKFVKKKTKLRISKRLLEENKASQISRKTNISHPLLCFVVSLVLISSLLSHYHRIYYGLLFVYIGYILLAVSTFHCRIWVLSDKFCFNSNRFCLNQNIARMNFVKNCGGALVDSFNSSFKHLIREKNCLVYTLWKVPVFGVFLVRIFSHSDSIRRDAEYLSAFSPNWRKYGLEKLRIRTLFMQC